MNEPVSEKQFKCTIWGEDSFRACPFDTGEVAICYYTEALKSLGKTQADCEHWKEVDVAR